MQSARRHADRSCIPFASACVRCRSATSSSRGVFVFWSETEGGDRWSVGAVARAIAAAMPSSDPCTDALNALLLASRSGCDSKDALELVQRSAEMMRASDEREALSAAGQR